MYSRVWTDRWPLSFREDLTCQPDIWNSFLPTCRFYSGSLFIFGGLVVHFVNKQTQRRGSRAEVTRPLLCRLGGQVVAYIHFPLLCLPICTCCFHSGPSFLTCEVWFRRRATGPLRTGTDPQPEATLPLTLRSSCCRNRSSPVFPCPVEHRQPFKFAGNGHRQPVVV